MKYKFLRISLLSTIAFLFGGGVALGALRAADETETIFSATVKSLSSSVKYKKGTTEISSDYATIVGGKMYAVSEQSTEKELIKAQNKVYYFSMTNNDTYFKVELDEALKEGDVISATVYAEIYSETKNEQGEVTKTSPGNRGFYICPSESRDTKSPSIEGPQQENKAAAVPNCQYIVKADDGLVGLTTIYLYRVTGNTTYFGDFTITRAISEEGDEPAGDFGDASIEGEWEFTLDWHYLGSYSNGVSTDTYTATLNGNTVTFQDPYGYYDFVAEFTAENTLTFKVAPVREPSIMTMTQNPFIDGTNVTELGIDDDNFVFETFTATYDPSKGTITFPEGAGLVFGPVNAEGTFSSYEDGFDFIAASKASAGEDEGNYADESIVGEWNFAINDRYADADSRGEVVDKFTATLDGNTVTFESAYGDGINIIAKFTAENTLTFSVAAVGNPATYTVTQHPFTDASNVLGGDYTDLEAFEFNTFNATYDPERGSITFPEGVGLAYGYANVAGAFNYHFGAFDLYYAYKEKQAEEDDDDGEYEVVNTYTWPVLATDIDGAKDGEAEEIEIEVRMHSNNKYSIVEQGNTNYLNDQVIWFTYNEDTELAEFTASYAGEIDGKHVWFSPFVSSDNGIEVNATYAVTFNPETGFAFPGDSGFGWFICSSADMFDAAGGVYTAFYVSPSDDDDTNGLNKITNVNTKSTDVYSLDGKLVRKHATTLDGLKGLYIVGGKKVILN